MGRGFAVQGSLPWAWANLPVGRKRGSISREGETLQCGFVEGRGSNLGRAGAVRTYTLVDII